MHMGCLTSECCVVSVFCWFSFAHMYTSLDVSVMVNLLTNV